MYLSYIHIWSKPVNYLFKCLLFRLIVLKHMIYLRWKLYTRFYRPLTFHKEYYILSFVLLKTVVWGRFGSTKMDLQTSNVFV